MGQCSSYDTADNCIQDTSCEWSGSSLTGSCGDNPDNQSTTHKLETALIAVILIIVCFFLLYCYFSTDPYYDGPGYYGPGYYGPDYGPGYYGGGYGDGGFFLLIKGLFTGLGMIGQLIAS